MDVKSNTNERGAAAVELALILPLLLLILFGIMEFGRAYNVQVSLTQAAREGARYAAVHYQEGGLNVSGAALSSAPALDGLGVSVTDNASSCAPGSNVKVTTSVSLPSMTGFLDGTGIFPLNLSGVGVMRCGG
ncbi:TadE/TadG family type IV pilus assembly protein [Paenarthrobacter nicotinovorans]|uniref:TadE/TadG family type IV pilus assembly protein n=1 Tax=Paenarthrobacter nicotinovorans TaxID=29320 RepID=UPI0027D8F22B|nr:TadE/TadG family type IV pilus assembly protein [Paenarthrobacter nicotinovorans]